ncbi:MAG TPA: Gfo/Idh/MocA family oxidoreductase [Ignavibacteriaceae bacterium]|nr:Gfo/Idh/MocA family oxidoreductase [Ignavibacteriaceae bacterium]
MEKTRVAVIGLGSVAQLVHLPNLVKIKNAEITAVVEVNKNRLHSVADKYGIKKRFKDYTELLSDDDTEAVIIATPTHLHKEIAIACLSAGKDVLVEKPLARNSKEGQEIIECAKKNNRKLMVGMNLRYRPDSMLIRSLIDAGEIGKPFYIKCGWIRKQSSSEKWFTKREEAGGGVILDLGINLVDLALWLADYPKVISISTKNYFHNSRNLEDTSLSFIRCENLTISLEASWSMAEEKDIFYTNVYGTKGSIGANPFKLIKVMADEHMDLGSTFVESPTEAFKKSYLNELKSFIGAIRGLNPVFSSGEEALQLLQIAEAMYKSAEKDQEIKIT